MTPNKLKEHLAHLNKQFAKELEAISNEQTKSNLVKIRTAIYTHQQLLYDTNKHIDKTIKKQ